MLSLGPARRWLYVPLLAWVPGLAGCAEPPHEPAEFALALVGPEGPGLPDDVAFVRLTYRIGDAAPELNVARVADLDSADGHRSLALGELPAGSSVSVRIEGQLAGGEIAYVGSIGPLALGPGEHVTQRVVLVAANESQVIAAAPPGRFLHGATALDDGRVLISGGFAEPVAATCPAGAPEDSRCYRAAARDDAWLFDPNSLAFHQVPSGLLEARAGHSATRLPDGRVLLAGGAREALLVFDAAAPCLPRFIPIDAADRAAASASFELFEPDAGASSPRDPARGQMVGRASDPSVPGPLSVARFLHAAAEIAEVPNQVLLVGGIYGPSSALSFERFDLRRAGGYGSSRTSLGPLQFERSTPSALSLLGPGANAVWIFGGNQAHSNAELAERWIGASSPSGMTSVATTTAFPEPSTMAPDAPHPEYAFPRALAARFADRGHALVAAAYPPHCGHAATPTFPETSVLAPLASCGAADALKQCFMVDAKDGTTLPCDLLQPHLAGAAAELADGVLLSGGLSGLADDVSMSIERFQLAENDASQLVALPALALAAARAFHTSTGLPEGGALSVGGLRFDTGAPALAEGAEVVRW